MTEDDIIRMAREAADQSPREDWNTNAWVFGEDALKRFAEKVAAAEREAIIDIIEDYYLPRLVTGNMMNDIRARGEK